MKTKLLLLLSFIIYFVNVQAQKPGSGNTLNFDGSNDHIDASANAWFPDDKIDDFTYEAWINLDDVSGTNTIIDYAWTTNTSEPHSLFWVLNGELATRHRNDNASSYFVNMTGGTITAGTWTHVALTKVGGTYTLYVNGISVNSTTVTINPSWTFTRSKFVIGTAWNSNAYQAGTTLDGNIDEVRVWKKGLSQNELRDWMCRKVTNLHPKYSDLAHYYKLDEGSGTALADETGTNNTTTHANFGPNPTWETSGAAIGDMSSQQYGSGNTTSVTQAHSDGSSFNVNGFSGVPLGAHVYLVNQAPNTSANALSGNLESTRYYGTFIIGGTSPTYSATYDYSGNTNIDGISTESETRITKRADNSVSNWTLNSNALDLSVRANSITFCGESSRGEYAAGFDNTSLPQRPGSGYALEFDNLNDFVRATENEGQLPNLSISAWIYHASSSSSDWIWWRSANGSNIGSELYISSSDLLSYGENDGAYFQLQSNSRIPINTWTHVAVTKQGSNVNLYINGILDATTNTFPVKTLSTGKFVWGARDRNTTDGFFEGKIDEGRIFNTRLTDTEIRDWMCKKITSSHPKYCNLVSYYRFDENTGNTLIDYKGSNNGTLINSPTYVLSGAALGDESNHNYGNGNSTITTLTHSDGSNFTINSFTGSPVGAHVYLVKDTMNSSNNSISGNLEVTRYYGTFIVGGFTPSYTTTYNYSGNQNLDGITNENEIRLLKRANNSISNWTLNSNDLDLSTTTNSITNCGQTLNAEFAAGFDNTTLQQRPGSGYALEFDGINNQVVVPHNSSLNFVNADFTIEAWVKPEVIGNETILSKGHGNGASNPDVIIFELVGGVISMELGSTISGFQWAYANTVVPINKWSHVAVSYDFATKTATFYLNGVADGTHTFTNLPHYNADANPLFIGKQGNFCNCNFFNGGMDEVRIWNTKLSVNEIREYMCKKITGAHPDYCDLLAYYRFDENTGTTLTDYAGSHDGTLTNGPVWALSGAAIGDESSYDYGNGNTTSVTQTHADGSAFTIDDFSGTPNGAQVYLVNEEMNSTLNNLSGDLEQSRYFGTFIIGGSNPTYKSQFSYNGNNNILESGMESQVRLAKRGDNSSANWFRSSVEFNLDASSNLVSICGETGNSEYALGYDNSILVQRPGSGYALNFNGSNHVSIPFAANQNLTSFTVSAWIKTTQTSGAYHRVVSKPAGGGQNYSLAVHYGKAHIRFDNGVGRQAESTTNVNDGKWHFISGTYDHATHTIKIYVDGVMEQSVSTGSNPPTTSNEGLFIGRFSNAHANNYIGSVDEVSVFNSALTETEVRTWMCKKTTSSHSSSCNLIAYYRFDENTGSTLIDYANGNNGTLGNNPTYELSGAPLGDFSAFIYSVSSSDPSITLTTPSGDEMSVKMTAGTADAMQLYYVNEAPTIRTPPSGLDKVSGIGYWGVKLFGSIGGVYEIVYDYEGHIGINDESVLGLASRDNNADLTWSKESTTTLNTSENTLTLAGQTGTQFILGSGSVNPLPVELLEFNADIDGSLVKLTWKTASEENNDYFTIERSLDGINFTALKEVKSNGNSHSIQQYTAYDLAPAEGINYYRLKLTNFDGEVTYSSTRIARFNAEQKVSLFPNPTNGLVHINIENETKINRIEVTDIQGKVIKQFTSLQGKNFDLTLSQKGVYFIHFHFVDGTKEAKRLVRL